MSFGGTPLRGFRPTRAEIESGSDSRHATRHLRLHVTVSDPSTTLRTGLASLLSPGTRTCPGSPVTCDREPVRPGTTVRGADARRLQAGQLRAGCRGNAGVQMGQAHSAPGREGPPTMPRFSRPRARTTVIASRLNIHLESFMQSSVLYRTYECRSFRTTKLPLIHPACRSSPRPGNRDFKRPFLSRCMILLGS